MSCLNKETFTLIGVKTWSHGAYVKVYTVGLRVFNRTKIFQKIQEKGFVQDHPLRCRNERKYKRKDRPLGHYPLLWSFRGKKNEGFAIVHSRGTRLCVVLLEWAFK